MPPDAIQRHAQVDALALRRTYPALRFGTASNCRAGWLGQVSPFLGAVPDALNGHRAQTHLETLPTHLPAPPYFAWMETHGLGVFYFPWKAPPAQKRWGICNGRFRAAIGEAVLRLLTSRETRYADTYALAKAIARRFLTSAERRAA